MNLRPGTIVNERFQIVEFLGEGGFATVFRASDLKLERNVALKFLKAVELDDADVKRFLQEGKALARIRHKSVASVYSVEYFLSSVCLVMEYVEGQSLATWIQENNSQTNAVNTVDIFAQLIEGLEHIHQSGIVHRDFSSSNVIVVRDGDKFAIKIIDLGLAWLTDAQQSKSGRLTESGCLIGNFYFMAPECCIGTAASVRSDIYSLGCVAYQLFSGRLPFEADSVPGILYLQQNVLPARLSIRMQDAALAKRIELIILKCLQKDPADRFASCAEILSFFRSATNDTLNISQFSDLKQWHGETKVQKKSNILMIGLAVLVLAVSSLFFLASHRMNGLIATPGSDKQLELALNKISLQLDEVDKLDRQGKKAEAYSVLCKIATNDFAKLICSKLNRASNIDNEIEIIERFRRPGRYIDQFRDINVELEKIESLEVYISNQKVLHNYRNAAEINWLYGNLLWSINPNLEGMAFGYIRSAADCFTESGDFDYAEKCLKICTANTKNDLSAATLCDLSRAKLALARGHRAQCLEILAAAEKTNLDVFAVTTKEHIDGDFASIYEQTDNFSLAEKHYRKIIAYSVQFAPEDVLRKLARVLRKQGKVSEAIEIESELKQLKPKGMRDLGI